jgi:prepilin signal peptidase PulO-like enzyme (type II secretory pathway)
MFFVLGGAVFIFGLIVGSFLNCVIYRLGKKKSFLNGRSFCPECFHILSWKDLIPIFSFLILKGKCRYCRKKISLQYPLVEFFTGILFLATFYYLRNQLFSLQGIFTLFYYWTVFSSLIVIFVYDLKNYLIEEKIVYFSILICLIFNLLFSISEIENKILSLLFVALFFLLIVLISKEKWMGMGDAKLGALMGIFLGWPKIIPALFFSFFVGAIFGIFLIILKKKSLKSEIPFGPFLVSGTIFSSFLGEKIINWYLKFFYF